MNTVSPPYVVESPQVLPFSESFGDYGLIWTLSRTQQTRSRSFAAASVNFISHHQREARSHAKRNKNIIIKFHHGRRTARSGRARSTTKARVKKKQRKKRKQESKGNRERSESERERPRYLGVGADNNIGDATDHVSNVRNTTEKNGRMNGRIEETNQFKRFGDCGHDFLCKLDNITSISFANFLLEIETWNENGSKGRAKEARKKSSREERNRSRWRRSCCPSETRTSCGVVYPAFCIQSTSLAPSHCQPRLRIQNKKKKEERTTTTTTRTWRAAVCFISSKLVRPFFSTACSEKMQSIRKRVEQ